MQGPSQSFRRRKARDDLSMMATEWPSCAEGDGQAGADPATPDDDHVHATVQHARAAVLQRSGDRSGRMRLPSTVCAVATPTHLGPAVRSPCRGIAAEDIPETRRYRLKNKLLGPPLVTEQLATERLEPADRPRRAGARLHLVLGLRHRGDADPAGPLHRAGRLHPGRPDHAGHPRASSSS